MHVNRRGTTMVMNLLERRRRPQVPWDALDGARATLGWLFPNLRISPMWEELGDDETRELVELLNRAWVSGDAMRGVDLDKLGERDRRRLERLVGKAAGRESLFEDERKAELEAAKAAEADARSRRTAITKTEATNFFRAVHRELMRGNIWADDVALLSLLLAQYAAGKPLASTSRFEGEGRDAVLVVDMNYGMLGHVDGSGTLDSARDRLVFLAGVPPTWDGLNRDEQPDKWLDLDRFGQIWSIRLGPKMLDALDGTIDHTEEEA
jgi:hypothetical protein